MIFDMNGRQIGKRTTVDLDVMSRILAMPERNRDERREKAMYLRRAKRSKIAKRQQARTIAHLQALAKRVPREEKINRWASLKVRELAAMARAFFSRVRR